MKLKKVLQALAISLILIAGIMAVSDRMIHAQSAAASESSLSSKVDEILKNQKAILDDLASIKEELRVIKVRITQSQ